MLNYIRAEFYKLSRRKYTYIALAVFLVLEGLTVGIFAFQNAHSFVIPFGKAIPVVTFMGVVGFFVCLLTADIVFAGQYKNSTLKNEVSFGLSRIQIYLGKLIVQTLLSIVYLVVMMGFFIGACAIFLPHGIEGFTSDSDALIIVGYYLACGFPLWVGVQAAACMCQFLISSEIASGSAYVGLVFVLDDIIQLISLFIRDRASEVLMEVYCHLPSPMLDTAGSLVGDWPYLGKCWLVGAFWVVMCTAIGLYGFSKKEIK